MARNIREEGWADNGLIIKMANISNNDLKNRVLIAGLGIYLAEVLIDGKKVSDVQVILVPTTNKGTVWEGRLQLKIVHSDVFNQFGLLPAARGAVE